MALDLRSSLNQVWPKRHLCPTLINIWESSTKFLIKMTILKNGISLLVKKNKEWPNYGKWNLITWPPPHQLIIRLWSIHVNTWSPLTNWPSARQWLISWLSESRKTLIFHPSLFSLVSSRSQKFNFFHPQFIWTASCLRIAPMQD